MTFQTHNGQLTKWIKIDAAEQEILSFLFYAFFFFAKIEKTHFFVPTLPNATQLNSGNLTSFYLHTPRFFHLQTCSLCPQPTLCSSLCSHKRHDTIFSHM